MTGSVFIVLNNITFNMCIIHDELEDGLSINTELTSILDRADFTYEDLLVLYISGNWTYKLPT